MFWEKLNQNKIYVILVVIICVLAGTIYSIKFTPKESISSSTVMLIKTNNNEGNQGALELSANLISTFEEVVKSELTVAEVKANLKLDLENKELNKKINLKRVSSSDTFEINVQDANHDFALKINTEVLEVFSTRINDMYGENEVYIIDAPHITKTIYKTPIYIFSILSALIGFCISIIYILILVRVEKNIKSVVDLEIEVFLKTLAQIPLKQINKKEKNANSELICYDSEKSIISKAFKSLRTNLQFLTINNEKQSKVIMITSAMPNEGKTYVAANMAISFAEIGKKVLLLDADMNTGRLDKLFNIPNNLGLSNYLSNLDANGVEINEFLNKFIKETSIKNLNLITSGTIPPNSTELLTSPKMVELIKDLKVFYDVIILDATSCLTTTDSLILTRLVNSTVIVANYRKTKKEDILKTKRDIQNVGGKIIGVVLNRVKFNRKRKTKEKRKEDFAKFKLTIKDKVSSVKKYIKERIIDSKQKLLTEKATEPINQTQEVIVKNDKTEKKTNILKYKMTNFLGLNKEVETEETEKVKEIKNKELEENTNPNGFLENVRKIKDKIVKYFSENTEGIENTSNDSNTIKEDKEIKKEEIKEEKTEDIAEEKNEISEENSKLDFSTTLGKISEKINKAKDATVEKTKNLKETTINAYNKTKENCVQRYNDLLEKKNKSNDNIEEKNVKDGEKIPEKKENLKEEISEKVVKNDNNVLIIIDAENACCRIFSKDCFVEKLIRGIDKTDGFSKAHYSRKLLRKRLTSLMNNYNLTQNQARRIDSLVYTTLCDYDDTMWLDKKVPSNKSELYVQAMAEEFSKDDNETDKEYLVRCQRLRRSVLEKAGLDIEYKLDNLWETNKINIFDKIALKKFANLYDIDQKMKNDNEIQKSKKIKTIYNDIIKGAENRLKKYEEKQLQKENEILENDKLLKQEELKLEKEKLEAEKKAEQEKIRQEKELQKQEKKEESLKRKREKQKQREEQRMQKELEKESKEKAAKIEEELLEDNLYPKTKYNKNL